MAATDIASDRPSFPFRELVKAGPDAPRVLVTHVVDSQGSDIAAAMARHRADSDFDAEKHIDRLIASQLKLVRAEGAGAGLVTSLTQMSSLVAGPAAVAVVGATVVADLGALAYYQVQLSLRIAAAYGHDLSDVDQRVREILSLHSLEIASMKGAGPAMGAAGQRVGKRLLHKYLKGQTLQALKAMFRLVGVKFSRAALVRGLPLVNVPANAVLADVTTRRTAAKARNYYRTLPRASEGASS